jgi:FkbM family methyltransferase
MGDRTNGASLSGPARFAGSLLERIGAPKADLVGERLFAGRTEPFEMTLRSGISLEIDPGDRLERQYAFGFYERPLLRFYAQVLRAGQTVLDGGAHTGYLALHAAQQVGPDGLVVGVEADPINATRLRANVARNSLPVKVIEAAITAHSGETSFTRVDALGETGWGSVLVDADPANGASAITVPAICIDDIVATMPKPPTLIKLDLQGMELQAMQGATETLRAKPILVLETVDVWWGSAQTTTITDLRAFLSALGYREHALMRSGRLRNGTGIAQTVFMP